MRESLFACLQVSECLLGSGIDAAFTRQGIGDRGARCSCLTGSAYAGLPIAAAAYAGELCYHVRPSLARSGALASYAICLAHADVERVLCRCLLLF